jgi:hypothetical protein
MQGLRVEEGMYRSLGNFVVALCICATSPVLAEEMLYCVDTAASGYVWDNRSEAKPTDFTPQRYTIKIVSDTERLITQIAGGPSPRQVQYECQQLNEVIACQSMLGATPWRFYRNTYTRAFLGGPPAGSTDPNIAIAYGTCTKF